MAFTLFVSRSEVFDETLTVVVRDFLDPNETPLTVSAEPLTFVSDPNAKPKFPPPPKPPGGRVPVRGVVPVPGRPVTAAAAGEAVRARALSPAVRS